VRLANRLRITLMGFAKDKRINIYTNGWRVYDDHQPRGMRIFGDKK